MACRVKVNRHGFLAFRLIWGGNRSWEGTGLKETAKSRLRMEARAVLISEEMEKGSFDYLKWFPEGNKAHFFKPKEEEPKEQEEHVKTVEEYYQEWIAGKKPPLVRKSAERDYRQHFTRYILPQFENVALPEITTGLLKNFRFHLLEECKLSLKTTRNVIDATFRAMVRDARTEDDLIDTDPFAALKWPRAEETEPEPFTEGERDAILAYFRRKHTFYHPFLYTLFWTGMRPSEATANFRRR